MLCERTQPRELNPTLMELTIDKLVYGGDAMGRLPADQRGKGKTVFLPFALPGERVNAHIVEQNTGFARAELDSVIAPSAGRLEPRCPYFFRCGGCHYQHAEYDLQLRAKSDILRETLRRTAKVDWSGDIAVHSAEAWNYRNRTRMKISAARPGSAGPRPFAMGYFRTGSHELLPVEQCPISSPLINRALQATWELGRGDQLPPGLSEIEFFANAADDRILVALFISGRSLADDAAGMLLAALQAKLPETAGILLFDQRQSDRMQGQVRSPADDLDSAAGANPFAAAGEKALSYETALTKFRVAGGSFFQTNRFLIDKLVSLVMGGQSARKALDLYAGVGLFASALARTFEKVTAVESSPASSSDLQHNVPANVAAVQERAELFLKNSPGLKADLVVVDPPRAGLGEATARALASVRTPRITYISCNPATLARDLALLLASGWRLEQVNLVDLFPQTYHIEGVVHLAR